MTVFFYKATDKSGKYIEGDVDAPDYRAAVQHVRRLNYFPIKISQDRPRKALASDWQIPGLGFFSRVTQKDLLTVTQQLATLIDAGITLDSSLSNVAQLADKPRVREVLNDVQKRVHSGSSFAEALAEHPRVFSRLYINMVRAGETGGVLSASLARLAGFMERSEDLKSSIRSAMVYPAILVLVGGGAVVFLFA
ncbi:MAG: type II secretion system protein GspF, partial [Nitrospinaceae bacterium]|nr:type II secretion system F family protein [Nitrospinaceae bacterium]NIR56290.1 type II secretion system F family protein [Nitrospinaceae bacterium]NIS86747.1 type II secretion system F family protein [Nitrospinaceae bacterium]NIT83582.1 type II secretion system F family protein [Nitrospinaceae bacterium]NIU45784.1 type II secretion system F family protein [Nitrospinaceae bacterium]